MGWVARGGPRAAARAGPLPGAPRRDRRAEHRRVRPRHRPQDLHADASRSTAWSCATGCARCAPRPRGDDLLHDVDVYVQGVNARLRRREDDAEAVHARRHLRGQRARRADLRPGRRRRGASAELLSALRKRLGDGDARSASSTTSPSTTTPTRRSTLTKRFPYEAIPKHTLRATARSTPAATSRQTFGRRAPWRPPARAPRSTAGRATSSWSARTARRTGHPLFVGRPADRLLLPRPDARGRHQGPGLPGARRDGPGLPGQHPDRPRARTSRGASPRPARTSSTTTSRRCAAARRTKYRYKGKCRSMGRSTRARSRAPGACAYRTTVHGPVTGYAQGRRQARSPSRASARASARTSCSSCRSATRRSNKIDSAKSFVESFAQLAVHVQRRLRGRPGHRDVLRRPAADARQARRPAPAHEGHRRVRVEGLHLGEARTRSRSTRRTGKLVNWNNRPAPDWGAADDNWSYGSIAPRAAARRRARRSTTSTTSPSVTSAMNARGDAGPAQRRADADADGPAQRRGGAEPARARMLALLEAWRATGSSRLDRDLDGVMDAGPAPGDHGRAVPEARRRGAAARRSARSSSALKHFEARPAAPAPASPAAALCVPRQGPAHAARARSSATRSRTKFCGGGDRARVPAAVWARDRGGRQRARGQAGPGPGRLEGGRQRRADHVRPGLLPTTIRYTNRPSGIQQVIEFTGHRKR